jgi:hypothetical protein
VLDRVKGIPRRFQYELTPLRRDYCIRHVATNFEPDLR